MAGDDERSKKPSSSSRSRKSGHSSSSSGRKSSSSSSGKSRSGKKSSSSHSSSSRSRSSKKSAAKADDEDKPAEESGSASEGEAAAGSKSDDASGASDGEDAAAEAAASGSASGSDNDGGDAASASGSDSDAGSDKEDSAAAASSDKEDDDAPAAAASSDKEDDAADKSSSSSSSDGEDDAAASSADEASDSEAAAATASGKAEESDSESDLSSSDDDGEDDDEDAEHHVGAADKVAAALKEQQQGDSSAAGAAAAGGAASGPIVLKRPEIGDWEDWETDPSVAVPWLAERECLLLVLEARTLLRELVTTKLRLERMKYGNLSVEEIRNLLLEQKDEESTDWISEIQELKRRLIQEVRNNHVKEREMAKFERRIQLLIKNRGDYSKDIGGSKSSGRKKAANARESAVTSDKRKLEGYEKLFYLLQTEPKYLASLVFVMKTADMKDFLDTVILTLFGASFSPREEFLILQLFKLSIMREMASFKKLSAFTSTDETVVRGMLTTYIRRQQGADFLKKLVGPIVKDVLSRDVNLVLKPRDVYLKYIADYETSTGKKSKLPRNATEKEILDMPKIAKLIQARQKDLIEVCDNIVDRVLRDLKKVPYGVRWICKTVRALAEEQYPGLDEDQYLHLVGLFSFARFINLAIVQPVEFGLVEEEDMDQVKIFNLITIGQVLPSLFFLSKFSATRQPHYVGLNDWIESRMEDVRAYLQDLGDVDEPDEYLRVDRYMELTQQAKPVITISTDEIALTHKHLVDNLSRIAKDKQDPLRVVIGELGDVPVIEEEEDREIQLTLTNKFKQDLEEDVSASAALYAETKELVITVLRQVPVDQAPAQGDDLTLPIILDFGSKWAKQEGNNQLVTDIKKIVKNLKLLEEEKFVSKTDEYGGFLRDVALAVATRAQIREQQRKEIKRLTQALRNLRKHHRYLEDQISHYDAYLAECRQRHFEQSSKKGKKKKQVIGVTHSFSYRELERKHIIVDSAVPTAARRACKFTIGCIDYGTFEVTAKVPGVPEVKIEIELDELLERNFNNIAVMELDQVSLDVNLLINFLNRLFVQKK